MQTPYQRINCDYYDYLEAWATLRTPCHITYFTETGTTAQTTGLIKDLFVDNHAEFMLLDTGLTLRLDRLITINDKPIVFAC